MAFNPQEHMMDLKGKDYLQVMWRLVWFREEHPAWRIETEMQRYDDEKQHAIFKATIFNEEGNALSNGYGSESAKDFKDYIEKAETKAVGRALAMLGYGTQFAPDLDEGERIVDSPVRRKETAKVKDKSELIAELFELRGEEIARRLCRENYDGKEPEELEDFVLSNLIAWQKSKRGKAAMRGE